MAARSQPQLSSFQPRSASHTPLNMATSDSPGSVKWMFADAYENNVAREASTWNPFRYSAEKPLASTATDLRALSDEEKKRPVRIYGEFSFPNAAAAAAVIESMAKLEEEAKGMVYEPPARQGECLPSPKFSMSPMKSPTTLQDSFELVTTSFGRQVSGEDTSGDYHVPFAQKEHWGKFQELLASVQKVRAEVGDNPGEIESATDRAMITYESVANRVLETLKRHVREPKAEAFLEDTFVSSALKGAVFVGHVNTDMDSIAGAIGAAALYKGTATKAEMELNGEIKFVLEHVAQLPEPILFDDVPDISMRKVCLVDHQEVKQMVPSLREDKNRKKRIIGVIDHHCLAESFSTDGPLVMDLRPWGSMSSIVAHLFVRNNAFMDPGIARLLMCAILSDTLNLQSVTTTDADRFAVTLLAKIGEVDDPDQVAREMFRAKTTWVVNLGPYSMVRGDQKDFGADRWKYGIAVLEVTDMEPVLKVAGELVVELRYLKIEKGQGEVANQLDFAFLFIVDVVKQCSVLLICGGRERELAKAAFPGCPFEKAIPNMKCPGETINIDETMCVVGPMVSRKAQFVPAFMSTLNKGFTCHKKRVCDPDYTPSADDAALAEILSGGGGGVRLDAENRDYVRDDKASSEDAIFKWKEQQVR